jgi:tyrosinase
MEKHPGPITESINIAGGPPRRLFLQGLGVLSAGLVMSTLGGCEELLDKIRHRPTRRWLRTGSAQVDQDVATYRQAVTLMKGLPAADPRNWANQAAIHGTVAAGFIYCQHGNDHFFDWHRAYLLYFERICQKLTGNAHFGLPYWNWNQTPDIPAPFLDSSSTLFLARNRTSMSGASATTTAELDPIFGDGNFFTFSQQLEGTPHNTVHTYIGGTMGTGGSASDPLFWAHHCMIDYCWYKWNVELGNDNTNDPSWTNTVDSHFVDADSNPATATAAVTTLMPLLSYQYESSAIGSHAAKARLHRAELQRVEQRIRRGADIRFNITRQVRLADQLTVRIAAPLSLTASPDGAAQLLASDPARENLFASVQYACLPPTSDFAVRVFVGLPAANRATPISDPHYAGSFAFFGTEPAGVGAPMAAHHTHQPRFLVNLTPTIERLRRRQEIGPGKPLSIQLVAAPFADAFEREDTEIALTSLSLITTPVIVKSLRQ